MERYKLRRIMSFELGQTIGEYEFVDIVNSSRSSVAYKVRNTLAQRFELLRVLRQIQEDPEKRDRFTREIKVLARINHPNIVSFFHATQLDGELVLTTELVEGSTLAERMEVGRLPIALALEYVIKVLGALEYAHSHDVIHRDVTPENIIITTDGDVKLTGFGLAKTHTDPQLTQAGKMLGSLHYISPEQVKGLPTIDARTDIYAIGVILYELVTGRKPFPSDSQFEVMFAHVNANPASPDQVNPEVPAALSELILKAMAKEPADRFQKAAEFRRQLESVLHAEPSDAATAIARAEIPPAASAAVQDTPARTLPERTSNPASMVWAGILVVAFLLTVLLFILSMRRG
jgi:eukaryotic-like serine/threonine-protein kinase